MNTTIVPEGFGVAIPNNPKELLKFIKEQKALQKKIPKEDKSTIQQDRLKKQDNEREEYETKLMSLEDYPNKPEGIFRIKSIEERLRMETEDALSTQLPIIYKEYDQLRLREKIKLEVEARKEQEKAEREARRKAAEERRAAVVERIRKQKEAEERRLREIEEAIYRKEEWERNRIIYDHNNMSIEDQLSSLFEQDYRDMMEKKLWNMREKERLLAWEKEQQMKDAIEEEKRKQRMIELEEKKKKLELLRLQQAQQKQSNDTAVAQMKEQGDRINKQLKIQNRAQLNIYKTNE